jgi:MFS family permease
METKSNNRAVWRSGNFFRVWLATVFSAFGDGAIFILLSWFVIDVTGSEAMLGTVLLCMSVPRLLLMLAGGVVADRISRKLIMSLSVLARAIVLMLFGLMLLIGGDSDRSVSIYLMAVVFGIVDAFFWPARSSLMPSIVTKEQLPAANSIMETSQQLSMVGGPLIASFLLHATTYPYMFLSIAVLFVVSMILIFSLRLLPVEQAEAAGENDPAAAKSSPLRDVADGIRYVLTVRILAIIMVISLLLNVAFAGPINIGLPVLVKQLGWDGSAFGNLQAAIGVGAIAGGIVTGLAKGFRGRYFLLPPFLG